MLIPLALHLILAASPAVEATPPIPPPVLEESVDATIEPAAVPALFLELALRARVSSSKNGIDLGKVTPALRAAGFRDRDRVTSIGEHTLASSNDVIDSWAAARDATRVVFAVRRAGAEKRLALSIASSSNAAREPASDSEPIAGIRKIDDTHFALTQAGCDSLQPQDRLASSARIVPSFVDGKNVGMKLFAIRPASALAHLGLQNGDTVTSFDDVPLTSPDSALDAYTRANGRTHWWIDLTRRGENIRLDYVFEEKAPQ